MREPAVELALLRFHLSTGVRVALRALVPLATGATAAAVLYGSPGVVLAVVGAALYPACSSPVAALLALVLTGGIASAAARRLGAGLSGWARHLPVEASSQRRAATAGVVVAQAPLLILVAASGLAACANSPGTAAPRLAGLVPLAWASALAAQRVERTGARVAAAVAGLLAWAGSWWLLPFALVLLVAADWRAGGLAAPSRQRAFSTCRAVSATSLWLRLAWRALGWRAAASPLAALLVLVPALLFLRNNELTSAQQALALRLSGAVGAVLSMASLADVLARRRPPWPWSRSFPWSALRRVLLDSLLLAAVGAPAVVAAACLRPGVLPALAATLPLLALRGAAAMRPDSGRAGADSAGFLAEGAILAGAVALLPALALAMLVAAPIAARWASEREQAEPVGRWDELHHLATGDPLSWSAP